MASTEAVKRATELLEQGVQDIFTSGRFAEYLDVMGRFHRYSARNCVLIMMQCPEATHVASYNKWRKEFNRQVRKGEKSIHILAPIKHRRTVKDTDRKTGETVEREATWTTFKAVPVFDVSQTDGDELPTLATEVGGEVRGFSELCDAVQGCATVPVEYGVDITDPNCHGYFDPHEGRICIRDGMSEAQTFKTLVHETAHSILHCEGGEQEKAGRGVREVQAEGVAYVVCKALGIDTGEYSFGYVAGWSDSDDTKALMRELEVIRKTANDILDVVT